MRKTIDEIIDTNDFEQDNNFDDYAFTRNEVKSICENYCKNQVEPIVEEQESEWVEEAAQKYIDKYWERKEHKGAARLGFKAGATWALENNTKAITLAYKNYISQGRTLQEAVDLLGELIELNSVVEDGREQESELPSVEQAGLKDHRGNSIVYKDGEVVPVEEDLWNELLELFYEGEKIDNLKKQFKISKL